MPERSTKLTHKDAMALVVLGLFALALFSPGLLGRLLTVRDMPGFTLPSRAFWRTSVLAGELPVWNPLVAIGIPTLAVPVHGTLYPGHLLLLVGSLATGVALTWAVHMWIAAAGGYALARRFGCLEEAALVAGVVLGMGGYAVSMTWNGEKTLPHAWIPWVAWAVARAAASPTRRRLVVAALPPALLCLAGDPFLLLDAMIFAVPFAVASVPATASRPREARDVLVALTVPLLLAGLLAAPALLPALVLRSATRRAVPYSLGTAELWSLHPVRWLELFVSRPFGDPLDHAVTYPGGFFAEDATVQECPWAISLYVGAATLALATVARGRLAWGLLTAGLVALLLALGRHLPIHAWARYLVPPLALARYPEKHVVVVCDALAILGSLGASRLLRREASVRWPALVALGGLGAALLLTPGVLRAPVHQGAVQSAIVLGLLVATFLVARRVPRLSWLPALVIVGDIAWAARPMLAWTTEPGLPRSPLAAEVLRDRTRLPPRVFRGQPREFTDFALLPGNSATLYGIGAIPGEDSARTPELGHLVDALAGDGPRTWELLRTSHLIAPVPDAPSDAPPIRQWKVARGADRPRAWMVGHAVIADGDVAKQTLASPAFDLEAEATVSRSTISRELLPLLAISRQPPGGCDIVSYRPSAVDLTCQAAGPALVVLADGYADGWQASVDGLDRVVMRTDVIYRGTVVAPGTHRVRFWYEPPGLVVGGLLAALGALLATLALVRRPKTETAPQEALGKTGATLPK